MSERAGTVGALDATSGKKISNAVVTLPAGTVVTNADGTTTTLAVDTPVFLQRVVLGDAETLASAAVSGEAGRGQLRTGFGSSEWVLASIDSSLKEILDLLKMGIFS